MLYQVLAFGRPIIAEKMWPGSRDHLRILYPSGMAEDRIVTFCARVGLVKVTWHLNFLAISWKRCKIEICLQWKTNMKSYMTYQMAAT